jgi:hypothetical protein
VGSSRKIEPAIERQGKQQCERQPRADLLISGHNFLLLKISSQRRLKAASAAAGPFSEIERLRPKDETTNYNEIDLSAGRVIIGAAI